MTRRAKIVVGVVMLSAVVLFGSAIAQATSPHTSWEQRVKAAHSASALHRHVRAEKSAKAKESRPGVTHAQAQTTTQSSQVEMEQPNAVVPEAADDDSAEANDDDQGEQADDDQGEQDDEQGEQDDEQGEQEDAAIDDQGDDSSQADVEHDDNDDSSAPSDDDSHEDDDTGDNAGDD